MYRENAGFPRLTLWRYVIVTQMSVNKQRYLLVFNFAPPIGVNVFDRELQNIENDTFIKGECHENVNIARTKVIAGRFQ